MTAEEWRSITGYEGLYEVSNLGRVRSRARLRADGHHIIAGRMLSPNRNPARGGYLSVQLSYRRHYIHRLVATAFLELEPTQEVDHLDGDPENNHVSNLEPVTHAENLRRYSDRRTHCKYGHELTPENETTRGRSLRACRTCITVWDQRKNERRQAA